MKNSDINSPLVEDTRPPFLKAFKYVGKKPHNIWGEYIKTYSPEGGLVLDPFAGSATSAFEAVRNNRKAIAFDLSPLSTFLIEALCQKDFNEKKFENKVFEITKKLSTDKTFLELFTSINPISEKKEIVQNFKSDRNLIYEVGFKCFCTTTITKDCGDICNDILNKFVPERVIKSSNQSDVKSYPKYLSSKTKVFFDELINENAINNQVVKNPYWFPDNEFPADMFLTKGFRKETENLYKNMWTDRVLYANSFIFNEIINEDDEVLQKQLLLGFIGSLHLTSKQCVPRGPSSNRAFSTSWGRSAYILANKKFEQNPLFSFYSSCLGKQSVKSAYNNRLDYLGKVPKIKYVDSSNKTDRSTNYDIKYGIIDAANILDYVDEKSVDFIITDPPYEDLVQYLDLSYFWLNWLKKVDSRMEPNFNAEIIIKKDFITENIYNSRISLALSNLSKTLKKNKKIILTFHNKKLSAFINLLNAIQKSGLWVEKQIHQPNLRSGEAGVANPYGTSTSDFYLRCTDNPIQLDEINDKNIDDSIENFIFEELKIRKEPTARVHLRDSVYNKIIKYKISINFQSDNEKLNIDNKIDHIINKSTELKAVETGDKPPKNQPKNVTDLIWFTNTEKYIDISDNDLSDKINSIVSKFIKEKIKVSFNDVLGEVFSHFSDSTSLTPNVYPIRNAIEKYAIESGGNWIYNEKHYIEETKEHSKIIFDLVSLGRDLGYKTFIGKNEQSDIYENKKLMEFSDYLDLSFLHYSKEALARIEQIDVLWLKNNKIEIALEVENSTGFMSAIRRCSNLELDIKKIMVLPDKREKKLLKIPDPLFIESFKKYQWTYGLYSDVESVTASTYNIVETFNKKLG